MQDTKINKVKSPKFKKNTKIKKTADKKSEIVQDSFLPNRLLNFVQKGTLTKENRK